MAHSAYPELGDSAIEKLLDSLDAVRENAAARRSNPGSQHAQYRNHLPADALPNVIPDQARAEIFIRLIDNGDSTRDALHRAIHGKVEIQEVLSVPAVHLGSLPGFETSVVSYTTDIPGFAGAWGTPSLFGPGSIHVAHTTEEHIHKQEMLAAVQTYKRLVKQLQSQN